MRAFRYSFRSSVVVMVLSTIILACVFLGGATYQINKRVADQMADQAFPKVLHHAQHHIAHFEDSIKAATRIGASMGWHAYSTFDGAKLPRHLVAMEEILNSQDVLTSVFAANADGQFVQMMKLDSLPEIRERFAVPDSSRYVIRMVNAVAAGTRQKQNELWVFLDQEWQTVGQRTVYDSRYDPRKRIWYRQSQQSEDVQLSQAFVLDSTNTLGIVAVQPMQAAGAVFGVSATLSRFEQEIGTLKVSANSQVYVYDRNSLLADAVYRDGERVEPSQAELRDIYTQISEASTWSTPIETEINGEQVRSIILAPNAEAGQRVGIAMWVPESDFTGFLDTLIQQIMWAGVVVLLVSIPAAFVLAQGAYCAVDEVVHRVEKLKSLDFSPMPPSTSSIREFRMLSEAFDAMRVSLRRRGKALERSQKQLQRLVQLGGAISAEKDMAQLMEKILHGAKEMSRAEGGSLYLRDGNVLRFEFVHNDALSVHLGGLNQRRPNMATVKLFGANAEKNMRNIVSYAVHMGQSVMVPDVYTCEKFDFTGLRGWDQRQGYASQSMLVVPLRTQSGDVVGALQLINAHSVRSGKVSKFTTDAIAYVEALAAQAATALHNRNLQDEQIAMVDGMVQLVARATDAKSPYTGAHCTRVTDLAMRLAETATECKTGPLAGFALRTADEWREFEIAAKLHDCGKLAIPEFVIDKATKLETTYNRIHEIRTRFDVLWRDAEIVYLRDQLQGVDPITAVETLQRRQNELQEDYVFIANCNLGEQPLSKSDARKLSRMAQRLWFSYFNPYLGLSHVEMARLPDRDEDKSCWPQMLLMNRPEHSFARLPQDAGTCTKQTTAPRSSQDMNLGELHNLQICQGTLTEEERIIVNEHAAQTVHMLNSLRLPQGLRRIPDYAGGHHEKLNGSGYPFGLTEYELETPARIMAIADIFEALTAADRPYKRAKTLSEAIDILVCMALNREIDPHILALFLEHKTYADFAERYLKPEQIDAIDVPKYLQKLASMDRPASHAG